MLCHLLTKQRIKFNGAAAWQRLTQNDILMKGSSVADSEIDHLILGGGAAAATAAVTLRHEDAGCSIMILSADSSPPYYRPALSKQFLLGTASEEQILLHSAEYYREQNIQLVLETEAAALDSATRTVTTLAGERIHYRHLQIGRAHV